MVVGYCRAGSWVGREKRDAQKRRLESAGATQVFCDDSGVFGAGPDLERAIASAQRGDVLAVLKPYHVARTTRGVLALINRLADKGVGLRIIDTPIDTSTTTGRMILASTPVWSLGASPLRAVLWDALIGRWRK